MTGIPRITERDQAADRRLPIFDAIADSRGRVSRPLSVLLDSPAVAGRAAHPGSYIRFEPTLAPQHRELAVITAAREFDCYYEWSPRPPRSER
jgi:4-carboxymuconolactone decarboxylase